MAEPHILIALFQDLKKKIDILNSKNAMMDVNGIEGLKEVTKSCDTMYRYIDSFVFKEQHVINMTPAYDPSYFSLTPTPRGHLGPTIEMRRYAAKEEKKVMDRIDRAVQLGRDLDANKDTPYFSIN
jgi:hypothetical protein